MSQLTCPSAVRLLEILQSKPDLRSDQQSLDYDHVLSFLEEQGVDLQNCDRVQLLTVIRDFFVNLTDADLVTASGGEVFKAAAITAAVVGGTTAVAVGVAAGVGGYLGAQYVDNRH